MKSVLFSALTLIAALPTQAVAAQQRPAYLRQTLTREGSGPVAEFRPGETVSLTYLVFYSEKNSGFALPAGTHIIIAYTPAEEAKPFLANSEMQSLEFVLDHEVTDLQGLQLSNANHEALTDIHGKKLQLRLATDAPFSKYGRDILQIKVALQVPSMNLELPMGTAFLTVNSIAK